MHLQCGDITIGDGNGGEVAYKAYKFFYLTIKELCKLQYHLTSLEQYKRKYHMQSGRSNSSHPYLNVNQLRLLHKIMLTKNFLRRLMMTTSFFQFGHYLSNHSAT